MEKDKIIEGNSIIATFLGGEVEMVWKINGVESWAWKGMTAMQWRHEKLGIKIGDAILVEQLEFHQSWDWIMPVWEKIQSLGHKTIIAENWCAIYSNNEDADNGWGWEEGEDKIVMVWEAVVDFLKDRLKKQE